MIGERIKALRKEKDLLQKELAQKLELSQQTISLYESNRREPDYENLDKIAEFFNVSTDYILGRTNTRNPEQPKDPAPIADVEEAMKIILDQPGLMLKGDILSDESKIILANSILNGIKLAEELERHKKGDNND